MRIPFSVSVCLCATALLLSLSLPVAAQELRGSVRGSVSDSSGSVVAGATVALRNVNTGVETTKQTSDQGTYLFDFVSPGMYSMKVELQGFRSFVQTNKWRSKAGMSGVLA